MRLSFVFGTRPEVIKLAPVILEARRRGIETRVVLSGQHRHLALPLLRFFGIEPDLDLDVMVPNQTLTELSARVLGALDRHKADIEGDFVVVQGDTTTACMAAYWAFCHRIRVAHVEAGLRTHDLSAPFPEEANRQLIGRIAHLHFAPTPDAARSLKRENVAPRGVHVVGNTAIDALGLVLARLKRGEVSAEHRLDAKIRRFIEGARPVLVTAHRRESFGGGFERLCRGIREVADRNADVRVVYPVHPNPNVRTPVERELGGHPRILLCDPVPYVQFVELMRLSDVLLTDSGGVQEEAPSLRKPILVMRDTTERPEGVRAGFARLVGTDPRKIRLGVERALRRGCEGRGKNPYGDGKSARRIVKALKPSSNR
jgi:UDP-N-acetylglucosamine 2-epimerase